MAELFPQALDVETLKDTAEGIEKIDMRIEYSFGEIQQFKLELAEIELELQRRADLQKTLSTLISEGKMDEDDLIMAIQEAAISNEHDFYEQKSKDLKSKAFELKEKIINGFFDEEGISCYVILDIGNKMKHFYDASNGILRQSIPFKRQQTTIFSHLNNTPKNEGQNTKSESPFGNEQPTDVQSESTGTDGL